MARLILSPRNLLEDVRASFWAMPIGGLLLAAALAGITHALDVHGFRHATDSAGGFVGAVHVDTVRTLLATLATATAGITGIAFSITITTLALASQQFGPHVLRTYMQRRFVQVVLAAFVGTVLFALLSLHWLGAAERVDYLPAVTAAAILGLSAADLVLLVLFVHVTATSIQVNSVIESVHEDHLGRLPTLFPGAASDPRAIDGLALDAPSDGDDRSGPARTVRATRDGYLQSIDRGRLVALATDLDACIEIAHEAGGWVVAGSALATVYGTAGDARAGSSFADGLERRLRRLVVLGRSPTPEQDPRFAMRQLHQIALRALSPALNDPQTAGACIARLGAIGSDLLGRRGVRRRFTDDGGTVRLIERRSDPGELLAFAFDAVIRAGAERADTASDLLDTIRTLAELHPGSPWLGRLDDQLERIDTALDAVTLDRFDAERLDAARKRTRAAVAGARTPRGERPAPDSRDAAHEARRVSSSRGGDAASSRAA